MFNFILIDDNKIDILIASKAVSTSGVAYEWIKDFTNAVNALEFIKTVPIHHHCIVLVDIQMPIMNGFEFMDEFEKLDSETKKAFTCMYLTSSLNDIDKLRAQKYDSIRAFVNKPLTAVKLNETLNELNIKE